MLGQPSIASASLGISLKVGDVTVGLKKIFSADNCNLAGKKQQRRHQASGNYTDKKENVIFPISEEIQVGAVAKSYIRKGVLTY